MYQFTYFSTFWDHRDNLLNISAGKMCPCCNNVHWETIDILCDYDWMRWRKESFVFKLDCFPLIYLVLLKHEVCHAKQILHNKNSICWKVVIVVTEWKMKYSVIVAFFVYVKLPLVPSSILFTHRHNLHLWIFGVHEMCCIKYIG